jgi:hypothetical protein
MSRYRTPYHEDADDLDIAGRRVYAQASAAGLTALVSSLISLGLLASILILGVIINHVGSLQASGLILAGILLLDMVAFVASVIGSIYGVRSQAAGNTIYRAQGLIGLVAGILCLVMSLGIGLVAMCVGLFVAAVQNIPGG